MILEAIERVAVCKQSLSRDQARAVMGEILAGQATDPQIAGLLVALHMKGETVEEIVGFAEAIRAAATPLNLAEDNSALDVSGTGREALRESLVDTCGTGGDVKGTFNISTATAFVVAGAGVRVAKHGNRSATSLCGSADVMEALGVNISLSPARMAACLREVGMVFLFAPAIHSATKHAQAARKQLRIRTVFNLLGPLTNPAGANAQVIGVYSDALLEKYAAALQMLGVARALVVHGDDGLDEISICAETRVVELNASQVRTYKISPEQCGVARAGLGEISGGDAATNAGHIREILDSKKSPRRDVILLNAAAALMVAGRAANMHQGIQLARHAIDSGAAKEKLLRLVEFCREKLSAADSRG